MRLRLVPSLLLLIAGPLRPDAEPSPPSYFSVSGAYYPAKSAGLSAEWRAPQGYIFQLEGFSRQEAGGFFLGSAQVRPLEDYQVYSLNAGGSVETGKFEIGGLVGVGYAHGLMHGKLRNFDPADCDMWCTGASYDYDRQKLPAPAFPLVFWAGYGGRNIGLRWAPHLYFVRGRIAAVFPLVLQIRFR